MTPEQLQEIQVKLDRAKEIIEHLTFLKGKYDTSFGGLLYWNEKSIPGRIQIGILSYGIREYRKALELELSQIEINTKEIDNADRECCET